MCLNIGTSKKHNFPFGTNGKFIIFGVPMLKHFKVLFITWTVKRFKIGCYPKGQSSFQREQFVLLQG